MITKLDKDNLSETKLGTTSIYTNQAVLNFKINKSNLKLEGQKIVSTNTIFSHNLSEITIANISLVKPYKLFDKQVMSVALINYVHTKTLFNDTSNSNCLLSLNNTVNINSKNRFNINYSGTIKSSAEQGKYNNLIDVNWFYSLTKYTYSVKYAYMNISNLENRNTIGATAQINYSNHLTTSLLCNCDYINNVNYDKNYFISLQTNILYLF